MNKKSAKGFSLIELMIIVCILGIIASLALPSFIMYRRRSNTVEAALNLRKMYDSAVAYYFLEKGSSTGGILAKQFPTTVGPTPAAVPAGIKFQPVATTWDNPTWNSLNFAVVDPFRYSYSFSSSGTGTTSVAYVIAQGDLDGDSVLSTFRRQARITTEGVRGGSGLEIVNEVE